MDDGGALSAFHFLRPWWLLVVPVALWLHWRLRRRYSVAAQWQGTIAPHLLQHLTVAGGSGQRLRPYQLMTVVLMLGALALAGPTWRREITPFTQDRAALIVALELTPGMLSVDQPPTRLARARQKIRDLLAERTGARTAIIAYAGSAHTVLPLTDDVNLIEIYLEALAPSLMPTPGDNAAAALELAGDMLAGEEAAGTILFMTDGIDRSRGDAFAAHREASGDQVLLLAFGTEAGGPIRTGDGRPAPGGGIAPGVDLGGLEVIADAADGTLLRATSDTADVDRLMRRIHAHLVNAIEADQRLRWHDAGYFLVWPLGFLVLLWARRGWTVQWV